MATAAGVIGGGDQAETDEAGGDGARGAAVVGGDPASPVGKGCLPGFEGQVLALGFVRSECGAEAFFLFRSPFPAGGGFGRIGGAGRRGRRYGGCAVSRRGGECFQRQEEGADGVGGL